MYEVKKPRIEAKIEDRGHYKVAEFLIDGKMHSLNVDYLPDSMHEWFLNVMLRIMTDVDSAARRETMRDMQFHLQKLIGVV